ncbi:unnamed protein product [Vitrella brassicaformis CCMP3155]|uniref:Uncharacterized protein n=3 Tax=Vitrella brassicaformis TaxID=1169539 RepID=A0A0G4EMN6_VITBC|nr:unnamed protein product [Vitrella brassicaformis CCMP3155]|mmetsp:Transcript_38496/g.110079  ORF Transcript_38496/g.110079 Transcript_38496/m.110079 type:complete len:954 (-) Transcript_38496:1639-4500(-)|eukprot:CEL98073.1 unnamed protein product [Vitrella brassicaformis CCMP3155]
MASTCRHRSPRVLNVEHRVRAQQPPVKRVKAASAKTDNAAPTTLRTPQRNAAKRTAQPSWSSQLDVPDIVAASGRGRTSSTASLVTDVNLAWHKRDPHELDALFERVLVSFPLLSAVDLATTAHNFCKGHVKNHALWVRFFRQLAARAGELSARDVSLMLNVATRVGIHPRHLDMTEPLGPEDPSPLQLLAEQSARCAGEMSEQGLGLTMNSLSKIWGPVTAKKAAAATTDGSSDETQHDLVNSRPVPVWLHNVLATLTVHIHSKAAGRLFSAPNVANVLLSYGRFGYQPRECIEAVIGLIPDVIGEMTTQNLANVATALPLLSLPACSLLQTCDLIEQRTVGRLDEFRVPELSAITLSLTRLRVAAVGSSDPSGPSPSDLLDSLARHIPPRVREGGLSAADLTILASTLSQATQEIGHGRWRGSKGDQRLQAKAYAAIADGIFNMCGDGMSHLSLQHLSVLVNAFAKGALTNPSYHRSFSGHADSQAPIRFLTPVATRLRQLLPSLPQPPDPSNRPLSSASSRDIRATCRHLAILLSGWAKIFGELESDDDRQNDGMSSFGIGEWVEPGLVEDLATEVAARVDFFSPLHLAMALNSLDLLQALPSPLASAAAVRGSGWLDRSLADAKDAHSTSELGDMCLLLGMALTNSDGQHLHFFHRLSAFIHANLSTIPPRATTFLLSLLSKNSPLILPITNPAAAAPIGEDGRVLDSSSYGPITAARDREAFDDSRVFVGRVVDVILMSSGGGGGVDRERADGSVDDPALGQKGSHRLPPPMEQVGPIRPLHLSNLLITFTQLDLPEYSVKLMFQLPHSAFHSRGIQNLSLLLLNSVLYALASTAAAFTSPMPPSPTPGIRCRFPRFTKTALGLFLDRYKANGADASNGGSGWSVERNRGESEDESALSGFSVCLHTLVLLGPLLDRPGHLCEGLGLRALQLQSLVGANELISRQQEG